MQIQTKGQNGAGFTFHNIELYLLILNIINSADFSSIHTKLVNKEIRIRGLKPISLPDLGSDSDDEDFDVNSAQEDQVEDGEYHQNPNEEEEESSETSDTDEVMKELEPESDNAMEEEGEEGETRDDEQMNPSVYIVNKINQQKRQKVDE